MESEKKNNSSKEERVEWTEEDDQYLRGLVQLYRSKDWGNIADQMNDQFPDKQKTRKQCRERWHNQLNPKISHLPWTKQEEAALLLSHMKFGNSWCEIAKTLEGRHNNMIKNRFYAIFRKVINKFKKFQFSANSHLEIIEIHYIISVIEQYLNKPIPQHQSERKRAQDFLYNLIAECNIDIVLSYKKELQKKMPLKHSFEKELSQIIHKKETEASKLSEVCVPIQIQKEPEVIIQPILTSKQPNALEVEVAKVPESSNPLSSTSYVYKNLLTPYQPVLFASEIFSNPRPASPSFTPLKPSLDNNILPQNQEEKQRVSMPNKISSSQPRNGGFMEFSQIPLPHPYASVFFSPPGFF